jgi:DNA-binding NtrC family response regulator
VAAVKDVGASTSDPVAPVILIVDPTRAGFDRLVAAVCDHDSGRLARTFRFDHVDCYDALRDWYRHNPGSFVSLVVQHLNFGPAVEERKLLGFPEVKYPVPRDFDPRAFQGFLVYALMRQNNLDRIAPVLFVTDHRDMIRIQRYAGFVVYPGQGDCSFACLLPDGTSDFGEIIERIDAVALRPLDEDRRRAWRESHAMVVGQSRRMSYLVREIERIGPSDAVVLLLGKPGVGKELVANAIHRCSHRHQDSDERRFPITVNIAALDRNLIEDELFGHERGAFTGAVAERKGVFETARGSTVFLDEIGDINAEVQLKLLRAIENRRIKRLGSSCELSVEMRIVAATNRGVEELQRSFRPDFYSRLVQHCVPVPSLKERWQFEEPDIVQQDLNEMFFFVVDDMNRNPRHGRHLQIDRSSLKFIHQLVDEYVAGNSDIFRGNIRTLRSILEQSYERALYDGSPAIGIGHIISTVGVIRYMQAGTPPADAGSLEQMVGSLNMKEVERRAILEAMAKCDNNQSRAAEMLGIHRDTLRRKLSEYGL